MWSGLYEPWLSSLWTLMCDCDNWHAVTYPKCFWCWCVVRRMWAHVGACVCGRTWAHVLLWAIPFRLALGCRGPTPHTEGHTRGAVARTIPFIEHRIIKIVKSVSKRQER